MRGPKIARVGQQLAGWRKQGTLFRINEDVLEYSPGDAFSPADLQRARRDAGMIVAILLKNGPYSQWVQSERRNYWLDLLNDSPDFE